MAVEVYGVTRDDLQPYLPFEISGVGASGYITTTMLDRWIEDGAAKVTGLLVKAGVGYGALDDNSQAKVRELVCVHAALAALERIGSTGGSYRQLKTRRDEGLGQLAVQPGTLPARDTSISGNLPDEEDAYTNRVFGRDFRW